MGSFFPSFLLSFFPSFLLSFFPSFPPLVSSNLLVNVSFLGIFCTPLPPPLGRRRLWMVPNIFYLKAFGMMNLHYEVRICQKIYNRVTMTVYVKGVHPFPPSSASLSLTEICLFGCHIDTNR